MWSLARSFIRKWGANQRLWRVNSVFDLGFALIISFILQSLRLRFTEDKLLNVTCWVVLLAVSCLAEINLMLFLIFCPAFCTVLEWLVYVRTGNYLTGNRSVTLRRTCPRIALLNIAKWTWDRSFASLRGRL